MLDISRNKQILRRAKQINGFCFTSDVDWASDYAVNLLVEYFKANDIPLTIFMTHSSIYLEEEKRNSKLEFGIHPNFIQPSTQGKNIDEIVDYCHRVNPNAKAVRCHRWFSSNDIYENLQKIGIKYESNICTGFNLVSPFINRAGMVSFPTFFEDGAYLYHKLDLNFKNTEEMFAEKGLYVINMHPMHFAVNTPYFKYMRDIKDSMPAKDWNNLTKDKIVAMKYTGLGIRSYIEDLVQYIQVHNIPTYTLGEVYNCMLL